MKPAAHDTESGPELLRRLGLDATAWCAEMVKRGVVKADPAPGGQFHGWMCNAIMNASDTGYTQKCRELREQLGRPMWEADLGCWFFRFEKDGVLEPRDLSMLRKMRPTLWQRFKAWLA